MRHVDDVLTLGEHELEDALAQQRACGAHGDGSEPGDLTELVTLGVAAQQRFVVEAKDRQV